MPWSSFRGKKPDENSGNSNTKDIILDHSQLRNRWHHKRQTYFCSIEMNSSLIAKGQKMGEQIKLFRTQCTFSVPQLKNRGKTTKMNLSHIFWLKLTATTNNDWAGWSGVREIREKSQGNKGENRQIPDQDFQYPIIPDWLKIWYQYPYPIRTRSDPKYFFQYPIHTRPEVKKPYPSDPGYWITIWIDKRQVPIKFKREPG